MPTPQDDRLAYEPARARFELEDAEQRGDVTVIRRARERSSGKTYGIERPLPDLQENSDSAAAYAALADSRSQLRHPHILDHFDVARDDESPYSVVEWAAGGTLAERLVRRGPLGEHELLKVANSVASALEFAAERRQHHGGIVPENLCLTADGSVKVAGFGFDEFRAQSRTKKPGITVDEANDINELCRTLYRLATAAERLELDRIERLPAWLREVLGRGLSEIRVERFQRAHDFLDELRRLRQLSSPSALRPSRRDEPNFPTLELSPSDPVPDEPSKREGSGESGGAKRSPSASSKGSGGSGKRGSPDEFPWRPIEDQYEILGAPKQGGMGAVYQARELATGRNVAIKRMKPGTQIDADQLRRFHREAASIAKLNHPHVLQLLQVGRDENGDYLVLEWASGGSLVERVNAGGKLTLDEIVSLARKIGSALTYAHGKGCIHRDIKPHNILISDSGEPKIADFGLARTVGDDTLTSSGGGAGSMHYMAPEQSDDARHADERSDLYSFAKTLYHAATGKKPIMIDPRLLPPPLRKPLLKCLNDSPNDRYPSVQAFLEDLDHFGESKGSARAWRVAAGIAIVGVIALATKLMMDRAPPSPDAPPRRPSVMGELDLSPDAPPPEVKSAAARPVPPSAEPVHLDPREEVAAEPPKVTEPPKAEEKPNEPPAQQETKKQDDPELVKRYVEATTAATGLLTAWDEVTDASKPGARPLDDNADHRSARNDLELARTTRDAGDLAGAVATAERAATNARRGLSIANVAYLKNELDSRFATTADDESIARVDRALAELATHVPEFLPQNEYDALRTRSEEWRAPPLPKSEPTPEATPQSESNESKAAQPEPIEKTAPPPSSEGKDPAAKAPPSNDLPKDPPIDPWARAILGVAKDPQYRGLTLRVDSGLTPLRADPNSGLYEFLVTATGDAPSIDANGRYEITNTTGIVLVLIPPGKLREGASPRASIDKNQPTLVIDPDAQRSEQPEHDVALAPFFIAKYELSTALWKRIGGKLGNGVADSARSPAYGMSWNDATTMLGKVGLRLPTEAQWEWACRARTLTPWPTGNDIEAVRASANLRFASKAPRPAEPVLFEIGSLAPNAFGLHDVLGNVAEFCLDPWTGDHVNAKHRAIDGFREDGSGPYRVFRGGCLRDDPHRARSAARDFCPADNPALKASLIGVRPARPLAQP